MAYAPTHLAPNAPQRSRICPARFPCRSWQWHAASDGHVADMSSTSRPSAQATTTTLSQDDVRGGGAGRLGDVLVTVAEGLQVELAALTGRSGNALGVLDPRDRLLVRAGLRASGSSSSPSVGGPARMTPIGTSSVPLASRQPSWIATVASH